MIIPLCSLIPSAHQVNANGETGWIGDAKTMEPGLTAMIDYDPMATAAVRRAIQAMATRMPSRRPGHLGDLTVDATLISTDPAAGHAWLLERTSPV